MKNKFCPIESEEGKTFWSWAQYHPIAKDYLFSIPNGGTRNVREAMSLKRQGTKKGAADYFMAYPFNGKHGLFIELKRKDSKISKPTKEQIIFLNQCEQVGYAVSLAYGAEQAINAVINYLK